MQPNCEKQHPECTKSHRFELENKKKYWGGGHRPLLIGEGTPLPKPYPFGAFGPSTGFDPQRKFIKSSTVPYT